MSVRFCVDGAKSRDSALFPVWVLIEQCCGLDGGVVVSSDWNVENIAWSWYSMPPTVPGLGGGKHSLGLVQPRKCATLVGLTGKPCSRAIEIESVLTVKAYKRG